MISSDIEGQDSPQGRKFLQLPQAGKCLTWCLHGLDTKVSEEGSGKQASLTLVVIMLSGGHHAICRTVILLNYLVFA